MNADHIRAQLERILSSAPFKNSRRYRNFLQHVVEQTLKGRSGEIKERSVGVDVFGRAADYDTASDPIVRITAGEVRKRLAQYYDNRARGGELRIALPSGSYVPGFWHTEPEKFVQSATTTLHLEPPLSVTYRSDAANEQRTALVSEAPVRRRNSWSLWWLISIALLCFIVGLYWPRIFGNSRAIDLFWDPVCHSSENVLVSIGELGAVYDANRQVVPDIGAELGSPSSISDLLNRNRISWADSITASKLTGFVQAKGNIFHILRSQFTTLPDLRGSPTILVGGFNNKWIMRLMPRLRFRYETDDALKTFWIKDTQNPARREWMVNVQEPPSQFTHDYGIIARFWDATTERPVVIVSGIAAFGTIAAGEFLTSSRYMDLLSRQAPRDWRNKNLEAVFVTSIVEGNTGPPQILTTYFW